MIFYGTIEEGKLRMNNLKEFNEFLSSLKGKVEIRIKKAGSTRTEQQNAALHLYFTKLAEALNDAGFDMRKTLKQGMDVPWSAIMVKELMWRPVQKTFLKKESTTELDKSQDIDKIYDIINRTIAERTGVSVSFPSMEEVMWNQENER